MNAANIDEWVAVRRRRGITRALAYGAFTIGLGLMFLGLMFWIVFMAVKLILVSEFPLANWPAFASVIAALALCALISIDALRSGRDDMSSLPLWLLREYIGIGPRLMLEGYPAFERARRWKRFDVETNTKLLLYLAGRELPARRSEMERIFNGIDWDRVRSELRLIPGVIFFQPDEVRVVLTLPLRLELRRFRVRVRVERETPPEAPSEAATPRELTPAEILGVSSSATVAEIKLAYRARVKECHPDRFASFDERSRELAEEWTKSLNAAYQTMLAEARGREGRPRRSGSAD